MTRLDRVRRAMAEFIGTAFLLMAIVGSGVAAQRLSPHDVGLELLENSTATATAVVAIILAPGPILGAHLNPMVSLVNRVLGGMSTAEMLIYWIAQLAGAALGTILSNLMFSLPIIEMSTKVRPAPKIPRRHKPWESKEGLSCPLGGAAGRESRLFSFFSMA